MTKRYEVVAERLPQDEDGYVPPGSADYISIGHAEDHVEAESMMLNAGYQFIEGSTRFQTMPGADAEDGEKFIIRVR